MLVQHSSHSLCCLRFSDYDSQFSCCNRKGTCQNLQHPLPRFLERLNARGAPNHVTRWKHFAGVIYQRFENIAQALHKCVMETWLHASPRGDAIHPPSSPLRTCHSNSYHVPIVCLSEDDSLTCHVNIAPLTPPVRFLGLSEFSGQRRRIDPGGSGSTSSVAFARLLRCDFALKSKRASTESFSFKLMHRGERRRLAEIYKCMPRPRQEACVYVCLCLRTSYATPVFVIGRDKEGCARNGTKLRGP